jgi:hypothetical protein
VRIVLTMTDHALALKRKESVRVVLAITGHALALKRDGPRVSPAPELLFRKENGRKK